MPEYARGYAARKGSSLATFGKGLANGYPVSAVAGRADLMREMEEVFFSFTFGGETLSLAAALATLGSAWHITQMTFKNHACCGHTFASIDGALALKARMGVEAKDIEELRIGTYKAALEVAGHEDPRTPAEARFSLKYDVATALTHGSVRLAAFEPARMADAATRALMKSIEVALDPQLDAAFPKQRAARVAIAARGGRREEWLQPTRIGDPDAPLSDAQLEDKYRELAIPVIGEAKAAALLQRLWRLEEAPSLQG